MNLQINLYVQFVLVVFVVIFENVSCKDNSNSRARRAVQKSNNGDALYLTQLLEKRVPVENIRAKARVTLGQMSHIESYAGYFTVNFDKDAHLFFWYFPAKIDPDNAPVVLYIEGALNKDMFFSVFEQHGPFSMAANGSLVERKESWNNKHNIIYMDSLFNTGYSFKNNRWTYEDETFPMGDYFSEALSKIFQVFPSLRKNDLFVFGSFFAGKVALQAGLQISYRTGDLKPSDKYKMNLKGVAIVNGLIDPVRQFDFGEYLYNTGLIDDHGFSEFRESEAMISRTTYISSAYDRLESLIIGNNSLFNNLTKYAHPFNLLKNEPMPVTTHLSNWVQSTEIRQALHVGNNRYREFNTEALDYLKMDMPAEGSELDFERFFEQSEQYRVLIYTGNLDILCSYPSVHDYFRKINWPGLEQFKIAERKPWYAANGDFAGYKIKAGKVTEVLVRNAGHFLSIDQPQWTLDLLESFTRGTL